MLRLHVTFFAKECIKCSMYTLCIRAGLNSEKFLDILLLTLHVSCASLMPVFSMELWSCFSVHMICQLTDLSESRVSCHNRILGGQPYLNQRKQIMPPPILLLAPPDFLTLLQILAKRREKLLGVTPIPKFIGSTTLAYHTQTYV